MFAIPPKQYFRITVLVIPPHIAFLHRIVLVVPPHIAFLHRIVLAVPLVNRDLTSQNF